METTLSSSKKAIMLSFLMGLVVGFGAYFIFDKYTEVRELGKTLEDDEEKVAEPADGNTSSVFVGDSFNPARVLVAEGENTLIAIDQPAGNVVVVSMIALERDGWVAVHELLPNGASGNILGARRFGAGRYFGEAIELLRQTEGGKTYIVILHADDGDSEFNHEVEIALKNKVGDLISADFIARQAESSTPAE